MGWGGWNGGSIGRAIGILHLVVRLVVLVFIYLFTLGEEKNKFIIIDVAIIIVDGRIVVI